jgi:hypothetical protein
MPELAGQFGRRDGYDRTLGVSQAVAAHCGEGQPGQRAPAAGAHDQHIPRTAGQVHQHPACRSPLDVRLHQRIVGNLAPHRDQRVPEPLTGQVPAGLSQFARRTRSDATARRAASHRVTAAADLDPASGQARLSYEMAEQLFKRYSGGKTMHQLRHSRLTHLGDQNVSAPLLMAISGQKRLATLQRYVTPSQDAVAALMAASDPDRRGR